MTMPCRIAREDFARVDNFANAICHTCDGRVEIEFTTIIGRILVAGEFEVQIAERLIRLLPNGIAQERLARQLLRICGLAVEDELPDLSQMCAGSLANVIVRLTRPQRVFVELNPLLGNSAKTIAPIRPLPIGSASSHFVAGWLYQRRRSLDVSAPNARAAMKQMVTMMPGIFILFIVNSPVEAKPTSQTCRDSPRRNKGP